MIDDGERKEATGIFAVTKTYLNHNLIYRNLYRYPAPPLEGLYEMSSIGTHAACHVHTFVVLYNPKDEVASSGL